MHSVGDGEFEAQNYAALGKGIVRHDGFRARQDADRPLLGWEMDGIGDAERPGSEHQGWGAIEVSAVEETEVAWGRASGSRAMPRGGTLAEFKHDCHVAASLGLAFMDVSLLARDFVIRKRGCGGLSQ